MRLSLAECWAWGAQNCRHFHAYVFSVEFDHAVIAFGGGVGKEQQWVTKNPCLLPKAELGTHSALKQDKNFITVIYTRHVFWSPTRAIQARWLSPITESHISHCYFRAAILGRGTSSDKIKIDLWPLLWPSPRRCFPALWKAVSALFPCSPVPPGPSGMGTPVPQHCEKAALDLNLTRNRK